MPDSRELTGIEIRRLRDLFDAAVALPPEGREAFLNGLTGADREVASELRDLVAAHALTCDWLDGEAGPALPRHLTNLSGREVGPYRLLRQIGSGGMGAVYLAERANEQKGEPLALKLIRPGFTDDAEMVGRFERERRILGALDHPNIARLLDTGSTAEGVPYLVMDYVDGRRIDDFCDERRLSIRDRLALFRNVCAAIQYANSNGIVHRDVKPGNILITPDGTVKLLDFGIARLLDGDAALRTRTGAALMTMEYASPEQVRGEAVGPASDVYSLGVVLYELLTGTRPYRVANAPPLDLVAAVCEYPPIAPSSAASPSPEMGKRYELRGETAGSLQRVLSGDLDRILLKALRKEPDWRYRNAGELSDDIGRYLEGTGVPARDALRYSGQRFVRRILHPASGTFHSHGVLTASAGLLGLFLLAERQMVQWGLRRNVVAAADAFAIAAWLLWSLYEGRRLVRVGKLTVLDRQSWTLFTSITIALGTLTIVSGLAKSASATVLATFWNTGLAIGMLTIGIQTNRLLTAGGVILLISALGASAFRESAYLLLATGMFGGMVMPGVLMALQSKVENQ